MAKNMENLSLEYKILVHKQIPDLLGVIYDGEVCSSDCPQLFPKTSSIEGVVKIGTLPLEKFENWEMKSVVLII